MIEVPTATPRKIPSTTLTNKYAEAINALGQLFPPRGSGRGQDRGLETLIIKRTTQISGQQGRFNGRTMKEVLRAAGNASGAVTAADFGTPQTVDDVILWEVDAADGFLLARYIGHDTASSKPIYAVPKTGVFRVTLVKDGGSDGTQTTEPTYTYTVSDLAGNQLATAKSPMFRRGKGSYIDATVGLADYASGALNLIEAYEKENTIGC
jgi:hypothetical protein